MDVQLERKRIECACTNLKIAGRFVGRAWDDALAPAGVNHTQYAILANVARHQPITNMDLAALLGLDRTTLYRAVAVLERDRLLATAPAGHGKALVLRLTSAGQATFEKARSGWEDVQSRLIKKMGMDGWETFLSSLREVQIILSDLSD